MFADVSSKNLDTNERGYALIGKPEDMHTWFFLYDESMRNLDLVDNEAATNHNYGYGGTTGSVTSTSGGGGHGYKKVDMTGSLSVPNLDATDNVVLPSANVNNYGSHYGSHHHAGQLQSSHQQQQQRNFMMYGHAQSLHVTPPPPQNAVGGGAHSTFDPHGHHGHYHHAGGHHQCMAGGLSSHHSRSVPSVAAPTAAATEGTDLEW